MRSATPGSAQGEQFVAGRDAGEGPEGRQEVKRTMREIGQYRCAECGAEFESRELLTAHQRQAHHEIERQAGGPELGAQDLRCVQCGQEFRSRQELETHLRHAH